MFSCRFAWLMWISYFFVCCLVCRFRRDVRRCNSARQTGAILCYPGKTVNRQDCLFLSPQAGFSGSIERGGAAGVHFQLAQHPRHMMVDRALANPQEDGDFQIPLALPQPPVNFPLA